tara:strand:- start:22 stop:1179 length:1158 start_codon:yes stop_codon:yes gene_type:complete
MYKYRFFDIFGFTQKVFVLTATLLILLLVFTAYLIFLVWLNIRWRRIKPQKFQCHEQLTVVVPFRNEQENLANLVAALSRQTASNFEVIFVNDNSTDNSLKVLENALLAVSFPFKILSLTADTGKKAALALGIARAQGEIILTTDADCLAKPEWVSIMRASFADETQLVSGPVVLSGTSVFQQLQQIEFLSLIGTGAAMIAMGKPTMANGANLAFRKSAYVKVGGYKGSEATPSGDDEFLLHKIHKAHPNGVRFNKNQKAVVTTAAVSDWETFKNQRKRWASKWRLGARWSTMLTAILVGLTQVAQLAIYLSLVFGWLPLQLSVVALALKVLIELAFLQRISQDLTGKGLSLWRFMISFIFYPFYALYFALVANFGNYQWKGRTF